jgi:hypothetical protein
MSFRFGKHARPTGSCCIAIPNKFFWDSEAFLGQTRVIGAYQL